MTNDQSLWWRARVSLDCLPAASVTVGMNEIELENEITAELDKIPKRSRTELLALWQRLYGKPAPSGIRRELMVPFLSYRLQENHYGGLKPSTRAELRRIARSLESNPKRVVVRQRIKPGTRLFRQWRRETHEVFVTESGYEYRGVAYKSLSELARKITGTRWSGPAFFGLNKIRSIRTRSDD